MRAGKEKEPDYNEWIVSYSYLDNGIWLEGPNGESANVDAPNYLNFSPSVQDLIDKVREMTND